MHPTQQFRRAQKRSTGGYIPSSKGRADAKQPFSEAGREQGKHSGKKTGRRLDKRARGGGVKKERYDIYSAAPERVPRLPSETKDFRTQEEINREFENMPSSAAEHDDEYDPKGYYYRKENPGEPSHLPAPYDYYYTPEDVTG